MFKNKDLTILLQSIKAVGRLKGIKFAYAMAKCERMIVEELELFNTLLKSSPEYEKYEKKRIELCEKHSKKNKEGKSILIGNEYILENKERFKKEHKELKKKYNKKVFEDREKQVKEFNEFLEKESSFVPFKVMAEDIPEDITTSELSGIFGLVEEEVKVKKK